ncbi:MAG TPA: hypothetical protein VM513_27275 [Kofleriaceae bacterium]|nr:hypothetical protein [Kofleriaceae bacterium]
MRTGIVILVGLAACGDNLEPAVENELCLPDTPPAALVPGPFDDPLAVQLPPSCVPGGLRDLPGRWFVNHEPERFSFAYPKFEGTCEAGFRRANYLDEDADISDGFSFQTWSDGTRIHYRELYQFSFDGRVYEYATMTTACMLPDGTLATVFGEYDSDRGMHTVDGKGTRFAPKDDVAQGLSLVGELAGVSYQIALDGTIAYLAGPLGLDVVDVSSPAQPVALAHLDGSFNDVKIAHGGGMTIAYLAPLGEDPTRVVDVTTPSEPEFLGNVPAYSHSIFLTPDTAPPRMYLANYSESIPVYDITAPASPILVDSVPIDGIGDTAGIHDLHVDGTRIYADKTIDGVVAVDVAAGFDAPVELGRIPTSYSHATWAGTAGGRKIAIHGDEGMTPDEGGAFLRVLDADEASPTFMQEIGRYQSRPEVGIHNMILVGDRAYIAYYQDGIRVLDLSEPTQPREIAHYNTWDPDAAWGDAFEGAIGLVVEGDYIYVADTDRGLVILRR